MTIQWKSEGFGREQIIWKADWSEDDHPRDEHGRFEGGGSDSSSSAGDRSTEMDPTAKVDVQPTDNQQVALATLLKGGQGSSFSQEQGIEFMQATVGAGTYSHYAAEADRVKEWGHLDEPKAEALRSYTGNGYGRINKEMRSSTGSPINSNGDNGETIAKIQSALDQSLTNDAMVVYRGLGKDVAEQVYKLAQSGQSEVFTDRAFQSTSLDPRIASGFAGGFTGKSDIYTQVIAEIKVPEGSRALGLVGSESEILLSAGSVYRIDGLREAVAPNDYGGLRTAVISLTYIGADPEATGQLSKAAQNNHVNQNGGKFGWSASDVSFLGSAESLRTSRSDAKKAEWDPDEHPRNDKGEFESADGSRSTSGQSKPAKEDELSFFTAQRATATAVEDGLEYNKFFNEPTSETASQCKAAVASDIAARMGSKYDEQLGIGRDTLVQINRDTGAIISKIDGMGTLTDERIAELQANAADNVVLGRATDPRFVDAVRTEEVSKLVNTWAQTSNDTNPRALAMQEAANREFGLTTAIGWDLTSAAREDLTGDRAASDAAIAEAVGLDTPAEGAQFIQEAADSTKQEVENQLATKGEMLQAFLRAQYDSTQDFFAKAGISEVGVFRGMALDLNKVAGVEDGGQQAVALRPLSSFTYNAKTAYGFARAPDESGLTSVVISGTVPVDRVLSCARTGIGCLSESEIVVMAGEGKWSVAFK